MSISTSAAPRRGKARDGGLVGRRRCAVAEEQALPGKRNAEPQPVRQRPQCAERTRARIGIGGIGARHRGERGERVVDRQRKHRHAVERAAGRNHAVGGDEPEARLQAHDVVEHGRHAAGARGVGAERDRHEAGRDRDRRARARTARDRARLDRVARDAVGRARAGKAGRELVEIGLADHDGAGAPQLGDAGRVRRRHIGIGRTGGGGGSPLTSMLSFTATGTPNSGTLGAASRRRAPWLRRARRLPRAAR